MFKSRTLVVIGLCIATAFAAGCSDRETPSEPNPQYFGGPGPLLPLQDPCESCTGIFLTGNAADWNICVLGAANDYDGDVIDDDCERQLAEAFAPNLYVSQTDNARRYEPYWAANLTPSGQEVQLLYAYAYNDDAGSPNPGILNDPLVPDWMKTAHHGDSEWVMLTVKFDTTLTYGGVAGRWVMQSGRYSAHNGTNNYSYSQLSYPTGASRDYPNVWIAKNKHANYNTQSSCEAGGWNGYDECADNVLIGRFPVYWDRNLGSSTVNFINCRLSTDTSRYHGEECFWTSSKFRGWYTTDEAEGVTPYRDILTSNGF